VAGVVDHAREGLIVATLDRMDAGATDDGGSTTGVHGDEVADVLHTAGGDGDGEAPLRLSREADGDLVSPALRGGVYRVVGYQVHAPVSLGHDARVRVRGHRSGQ